ncbi:MAG: 4-(cytidine 5'-diphospho)-2-C-methyl-D-erythritol kinase [Flavobacteriales bacterium]|nr:4-(cytidine 5'-diphospho)-2-C-methyl-D-erythritol kinase [Flavobacteriales bacterium]
MVRFPNAKINLGLHVVRRRDDGYHEIRTVLAPIPLYDILEAVIDPNMDPGEVVLTRTGRPVPGDPEDDLVMRAVHAIGMEHALPGLRVHLHKVIPIGGGLGGGSSDGTHMLLLVNDLVGLGLSDAELHRYAAGIGSDTAFFLEGRPCLARSRGELLEPLPLDLKGLWMLLIDPGIHVSTAAAFAMALPGRAGTDLAAIVRLPMEQWPEVLVNELAGPVQAMHPELRRIEEMLYACGAGYAAMSGSGSTMFGLFRERPGMWMEFDSSRQWVLSL